jgi:UDP-GlcNAc3NAcA epimerase
VTVVGARPQFIKAAAVSRVIRNDAAGRAREIIVHTGQHFDDNMSQVFFDELEIPAPDHSLGVSGGSHGEMTGRMLEGVERVLVSERPDWVLVYGDTNSTLAGALAAAKLHIPVAHVEAGLRSFNRRMPEEINRIVADRVSTLLFCPTETAVQHLRNEGITEGVHQCGDVMFDVSLFYRERARDRSRVLASLGVEGGRFALATCHRAENADDPARLGAIVSALQEIAREMPVVLPLHPRTRGRISEFSLGDRLAGVRLIEPQPFLDMIALEQAAAVILTDSGGVQKEAFFFGVPCVTLRDETEWVETVQAGRNTVVGADRSRIVDAARRAAAAPPANHRTTPYGDGHAANRIVEQLLRSH